jgi:phosphotriesterase-related protein
MANVETIRGPIPATELGRVLMHEHIFILQQESLENFNHHWGDPWWREEAEMAHAIEMLEPLRKVGISTIVDATAIGLGRSIRRLQRLNASLDLNIVVCTGVYAFLELPIFLKYRGRDGLAEFFVREIREGIDNTCVKAAFVKCAVEHYGIAGDLPVILGAAASASVETGSPIMVHTNANARSGLLALECLTNEGADPSRIVIAHASDCNDLPYLREIADSGAALGFDRFNMPQFNSDEHRVATLATLVADGYTDRIHLSHDTACFLDFVVGDPTFAAKRPDYLHISKAIVPALLAAGVSQQQVDTMTIGNPIAFFSPVSTDA